MHITLYHLQNSRSQRIVWLCEELNLDYELVTFTEHLQEQDYPKHPHPFKKFPTLVYAPPAQSALVLAETTAIVDFLCQQYTQLATHHMMENKQLADFYYWKNCADASFMPNVALKQIFAQIMQHTPFPIRFIAKVFKYGFDQGYLNNALQQHMQQIELQLKLNPWIAGERFSAADILLWFPLFACTQLDQTFQNHVHINAYLAQIESRPAFQRAKAKGQWSAEHFQLYWNKAH